MAGSSGSGSRNFTVLMVRHDVEETLAVGEPGERLQRPASIRADLAVACPIRGTAIIRSCCACGAPHSACWDWRAIGSLQPFVLKETRPSRHRGIKAPSLSTECFCLQQVYCRSLATILGEIRLVSDDAVSRYEFSERQPLLAIEFRHPRFAYRRVIIGRVASRDTR
jgi:hypothetical protein